MWYNNFIIYGHILNFNRKTVVQIAVYIKTVAKMFIFKINQIHAIIFIIVLLTGHVDMIYENKQPYHVVSGARKKE